MKQEINSFFYLIIFFLKSFFTFRKKVILFCIPVHPNLGDQAQLMCTEKWIETNYRGYKQVSLSHICVPFSNSLSSILFNHTFWTFIVLKLTVRKNDIFIGHSGYFFVDHHSGWFSYDFLLQHWNNEFLILPQTINFYAPVVKQRAARIFGNKRNLTILCRDEISFQKAKELFGSTTLLLYPDIVTSLIGTRIYSEKREGVLFCMRDDIEAFYSPKDIEALMLRFGSIRQEMVDTTINVSPEFMKKNRDKLVNEMIEKIATYSVVITDRYHGTIFSAIANTPVIVINSADHKLSSGVKWFPADKFKKNVQYAENLEEAYELAQEFLCDDRVECVNPTYFKDVYWDVLSKKLV